RHHRQSVSVGVAGSVLALVQRRRRQADGGEDLRSAALGRPADRCRRPGGRWLRGVGHSRPLSQRGPPRSRLLGSRFAAGKPLIVGTVSNWGWANRRFRVRCLPRELPHHTVSGYKDVDMKLRYYVVDEHGSLRKVRKSAVEALWDGSCRAEEFGCSGSSE